LVPAGGNWRDLPESVVKNAMGAAYDAGGGKMGFYRRLNYEEPAPTLVTSPVQKATMLCHPKFTRPLSVREYAAIQGFPDTWEFAGSLGDKYRQIGNAVPIRLGYSLGCTLRSITLGSFEVRTKRTRTQHTGTEVLVEIRKTRGHRSNSARPLLHAQAGVI